MVHRVLFVVWVIWHVFHQLYDGELALGSGSFGDFPLLSLVQIPKYDGSFLEILHSFRVWGQTGLDCVALQKGLWINCSPN